MKIIRFLALALAGAAPSGVRADVVPASLFQDHAVLQQGRSIPVWGTAEDNERITVTMGGERATTVAQKGRWRVDLGALPAGGPYELFIEGNNRVVLKDVLVGEVWLCSGQSNMERQLGLREGQKPIRNWESEVAGADFPQIRHFGAAQTLSLTPAGSVDGKWVVCTPETAHDFTAVGFFFGRALHLARGVPIGLIHSSWGGTPAEAWTSSQALEQLPEMQQSVDLLKLIAADPAAGERTYKHRLDAWFAANDAGSDPVRPWSAGLADTTTWKTMSQPGLWEAAGLPGLDGVVWLHREFELPPDWANTSAELHLGAIDDVDTTWTRRGLTASRLAAPTGTTKNAFTASGPVCSGAAGTRSPSAWWIREAGEGCQATPRSCVWRVGRERTRSLALQESGGTAFP